jgi:hypothetical protein
MAGANSQISLVGLDFNEIKNNLKTFLQSQDTFKDYNFEGAGLSVLLDVLSYNTQYNAFYLNMVANEMFLDTALQRPSVVSHAKTLNYVPKSAAAPSALIDISVDNVTSSSLTLPLHTNFLSESIDGVNYNFVTTGTRTENTNLNTSKVEFKGVEIRQGIPVNYNFVVNSTSNPSYTYELPDSSIDTSTISIFVQESSSNTQTTVYTYAQNYLELTGESTVYFLNETLTGTYEISFGDGIVGKRLVDGNIIKTSYITTQGKSAEGANNFVLMDSLSGFTNTTVTGSSPASQGSEKESIDSIKFQAPKSYSAQKRAVTKDDYITILQQNTLGIPFDAVNVWGGQENDPPVYGQVFVCVKPKGAYTLTDTQKTRLIQDVIKPISVMTVEPSIVDPDYTYIKLNVNVVYNPNKTTSSSSQIETLVKDTIINFGNTTLNSFNSTFSSSELTYKIQQSDPSIVANELSMQLQKKIYPTLSTTQTYNMYFGVPLEKGMFSSGVNSSPAIKLRDPLNLSNVIDGIYLEEVPSATGGISKITVINPGYGYQYAPTVSIIGDGTGATAEAIINTNGTINSINVTSSGNNYTSAIVTISATEGDTTGRGAAGVVTLEGQYGTIRSYYNNTLNAKTIFNENVGTIDYVNGIVSLVSFNPVDIDNPLGQLTMTVNPTTTIISSSRNKIITIDPFDSSAITVNVTAKSQ